MILIQYVSQRSSGSVVLKHFCHKAYRLWKPVFPRQIIYENQYFRGRPLNVLIAIWMVIYKTNSKAHLPRSQHTPVWEPHSLKTTGLAVCVLCVHSKELVFTMFTVLKRRQTACLELNITLFQPINTLLQEQVKECCNLIGSWAQISTTFHPNCELDL